MSEENLYYVKLEEEDNPEQEEKGVVKPKYNMMFLYTVIGVIHALLFFSALVMEQVLVPEQRCTNHPLDRIYCLYVALKILVIVLYSIGWIVFDFLFLWMAFDNFFYRRV